MFLFDSQKKEIIDIKETLNKFIETTQKITEELKEDLKEVDKRFKETDERLDKRFKETDERIRKLEGLFTSQWGKLIEAMAKPAALKLFQDRGIEVHEIYTRVEIKRKNFQKEFDIILVNQDTIIVVEVKSTLKVNDVKEHIEDLKNFYNYMPNFKGKKVYGSVAYISCDEDSDKFAYRNGLFVITLIGENLLEIKNDINFKPVDFSTFSQV